MPSLMKKLTELAHSPQATNAIAKAKEGVEGVTEAAATATASVTGNVGGVTDAANTAVDSVSQALPDLPGLPTGGK